MRSTTTGCERETRRVLLRWQIGEDGRTPLSGIDYIEVLDDQRCLCVHFFGEPPIHLTPNNIRIEGGRRIRDVRVEKAYLRGHGEEDEDECLLVEVNHPGDFSTYTLQLVTDVAAESWAVPAGIDPRYSSASFSFKANCPIDLDCAEERACAAPKREEPEISYLAKDYSSFRQLILERLSLIMPDWQERHLPDLGIALVELLAYVGDHLSYHQDAVATEAYIGTARQRISVRRHARLVDYFLHEGCNARAWVHIDVKRPDADVTLKATSLFFLTAFEDAPAPGVIALLEDDPLLVGPGSHEVFRPLLPPGKTDVRLSSAHNEIRFYTWGNEACCLPRGATSATLLDGWIAVPIPKEPAQDPKQQVEQKGVLRAAAVKQDKAQDHKHQEHKHQEHKHQEHKKERRRDRYQDRHRSSHHGKYGGHHDPKHAHKVPHCPEPEPKDGLKVRYVRSLHVRPGDVLIFEEVKGPRTGLLADADRSRRHAVRITRVTPAVDPLVHVDAGGVKLPLPVLEIEWSPEDALPFPLCLSALVTPSCNLAEDISVARGNVILVDHGRPVIDPLWHVPLAEIQHGCEDKDRPADAIEAPGKLRPVLKQSPLTYGEPLPSAPSSAAAVIRRDPRVAMPYIHVDELDDKGNPTIPWSPRYDLLDSGPDDRVFVVEIDNDQKAHVRFGDGEMGRALTPRATLRARYRVGDGPSGNVGADSIVYLARTDGVDDGIPLAPRNPLPASGGTPPESLEDARVLAGATLRTRLLRAVSADDYAALAAEMPALQGAAAALRWTGSWYEALVAIDPLHTEEPSPELIDTIRRALEARRRIGHDVVVARASYVPLDIALDVCVKPHYLRAHVESALLGVLGNGALPGGLLGLFHPDTLTLGGTIYASRIIAAAQSVTGVESVRLTRFQRLFDDPVGELEKGELVLGPLEVARLDNERGFPENGVLRLSLRGGR